MMSAKTAILAKTPETRVRHLEQCAPVFLGGVLGVLGVLPSNSVVEKVVVNGIVRVDVHTLYTYMSQWGVLGKTPETPGEVKMRVQSKEQYRQDADDDLQRSYAVNADLAQSADWAMAKAIQALVNAVLSLQSPSESEIK